MDAEKADKLTEMASVITRQLLTSMLDEPLAMAFMTYYEIAPEEIEDKVYQILEYREKTDPEAEE